MKLQDHNKNLILKKLNVKNYIIFHFDHKWEDIKNIESDLFKHIVILQKNIKKTILISSFKNNSLYFKKNLANFNLFDPNKFYLYKKNNLPIYLIKDPEIFLQERLVSTSEFSISCHSGILVHSAAANKCRLIDVLNENEILIQKCWAPLNNYFVVKKSNKSSKNDLGFIFSKIQQIIKS